MLMYRINLTHPALGELISADKGGSYIFNYTSVIRMQEHVPLGNSVETQNVTH